VECVSLWVGDRLGPVERACLRSILRQGHSVALYCYETPAGVPAGIEVRDASSVLPKDHIFHHERGSVAMFSDWFRYELQRLGAGTWIDTDVYLLASLDEQRPFLFGEELPGVINNAILRLPMDSPVLAELLSPFGGRTPTWLPRGRYWQSRVREWITGRADVSKMPWGTTGPMALTAAATKHGLLSHALPQCAFYPVRWQDAGWITDPGRSLADMVSDSTVAVHLWNEMIKSFKNDPAPGGSFLERLHSEGAE
jgi:hypothetical protein